MFSQPGPVNLDLAREISRHLAGESQLVNPWTSEELIELVRLAEYRISEVAPFSFPPATAVMPLGPREWGDAVVEEFASTGRTVRGANAGQRRGTAMGDAGPAGSGHGGRATGSAGRTDGRKGDRDL